MANKNLKSAKKAKNDEFYTQYADIQREIEAYLEFDPDVFRGKVVYCNCDDPYESNFFRYFVLNFKKLGLKQLITTSYKPSPVANKQLELYGDDETLPKSKGRQKINANKFIINEVHKIAGDGEFNLKSVAKKLKANKNNEWTPLEGYGLNSQTKCNTLSWLRRCCDGTKVYAIGGGGAVRNCPAAPSRGIDPANRGKSGSRAIKHCSGVKT